MSTPTELHPYPVSAIGASAGRFHFVEGLRLWHVLVVALLVRTVMMVGVAPWEPAVVHNVILQSDAEGYHHMALQLLENGNFSDQPIRTPGYPIVVAALYSIAGAHPAVIIIFQILLDLLICYGCFRLVKHLFGRPTARLAALLYAVNPTAIIYANTVMSDTLFLLLLAGSVGFLFRAVESSSSRRSLGYYLAFALCLGLAALTRPVALYLAPLLLLVILWKERRHLYAVAWKLTLSCVTFFLVISPWLYHNYRTYGVAGLSSSGAFNSFYLYAVTTEMYRSGVTQDQAAMNIRTEVGWNSWPDMQLNAYQQHLILADVARQYLIRHPGSFAWATMLGIGQMYWSTGTSTISFLLGFREQKVNVNEQTALYGVRGMFPVIAGKKTTAELIVGALMLINHIAIYSLVCFGLWHVRRQVWRPQILALIVLILGYTLMIGAAGIMRFKLPLIPFYLAFAGVGLRHLLELRRGRVRASDTADATLLSANAGIDSARTSA